MLRQLFLAVRDASQDLRDNSQDLRDAFKGLRDNSKLLRDNSLGLRDNFNVLRNSRTRCVALRGLREFLRKNEAAALEAHDSNERVP